MSKSSIEWTEMTWNPVTGCDKVSKGCRNCYAAAFAKRLKAMGVEKYRNAFELTVHPEALDEPYKWKNPKMVFVNSMSDLFHEDLDKDFIKDVFKVMSDNKKHVFQILTKRSSVLKYYDKEDMLDWNDNIWMGVSIENRQNMYRIDDLRETRAKVKFLSCEPLLGPLKNMNLDGIDWVIVGGESGPGARPMKKEWAIEIKEQCKEAGVPFFFKQWGAYGDDGIKRSKKANGRILEGETFDEMPV